MPYGEGKKVRSRLFFPEQTFHLQQECGPEPVEIFFRAGLLAPLFRPFPPGQGPYRSGKKNKDARQQPAHQSQASRVPAAAQVAFRAATRNAIPIVKTPNRAVTPSESGREEIPFPASCAGR